MGSDRPQWVDAQGEKSAKVVINWDGKPPAETLISRLLTTEHELEDRNMLLSPMDSASIKTDVQVELFRGMCTDTGKAVLYLVL